MGADSVSYAAKYFGAPHSTGFVIGTREVVDKVALQSFISYEMRRVRGVGRPQKIDRQEIIGAVEAAKIWMNINHEDRLAKAEKICIKILNKDDKSKKIYKFILKILKQNKTKESKDYHFWFVELLAASCIVKKIKDDSNFIYFPDEGFLQRSFLINSILKDKDINKIKRYLKLVPKSEIIINIKSKKTKIQKVHFDRKKDSIGTLKSKA